MKTMIAILLLAAFAALATPCIVSANDEDAAAELCPEGWISGPFYITVCGWWECPRWSSPTHLILVEHCPSSGLIRIPKEYRLEKGSYIDFNKQQDTSGEDAPK